MRVDLLATLAVTLFTSLALSARPERTVDVFIWPLSQTKSQTLAQISYTSSNATVEKYTAPKISSEDELVRVGYYHASGSWSGVTSSSSNFAPGKDKKVLLHLNTNGELYHIGFRASDQPSSSKTGKARDGLGVEVVMIQPGPTPHLNKPVVLNEEGQLPEKEPEKTFLQK